MIIGECGEHFVHILVIISVGRIPNGLDNTREDEILSRICLNVQGGGGAVAVDPPRRTIIVEIVDCVLGFIVLVFFRDEIIDRAIDQESLTKAASDPDTVCVVIQVICIAAVFHRFGVIIDIDGCDVIGGRCTGEAGRTDRAFNSQISGNIALNFKGGGVRALNCDGAADQHVAIDIVSEGETAGIVANHCHRPLLCVVAGKRRSDEDTRRVIAFDD